MRRIPLLVPLLLLLLLASPLAQAHARPITIAPPAGSKLDQLPTEIRIEFSEPINARATTIEVTDANGSRIDQGPARVDGRTIARVALKTDHTDQGYLVRWSTYSTIDGHRMAGSWGFAVGNATPPQAYEDVRSPLAVSTVFARLLAYVGLVVLVATAWLGRSATHRPPRIVNRAALGAGLVFLGSAFLFLQGASASGEFFQDDYTRRVVWQVVVAVLLGIAVGMPPGPVPAALRFLLIAAWAMLQGFSSHAAAAVGPGGAIADSVHLALVLSWIGAVAAFWLDARGSPDFMERARLTARVAAWSALGTIVTGVVLALALSVLADRSPLDVPAAYGLVFLYKMGAVVALLAFGAVNQFVHLRRWDGTPGRAALLRANLRRELINALVVLLLAAILATLDPQVS